MSQGLIPIFPGHAARCRATGGAEGVRRAKAICLPPAAPAVGGAEPWMETSIEGIGCESFDGGHEQTQSLDSKLSRTRFSHRTSSG